MAGEEEDIFESGNVPDETSVQLDSPTSPRTTEDAALSHAIADIAKTGGRPTAPVQRAPTPPPPQQPASEQPQVRDSQGNMVPLATLLEERERRQALQQQLQRYQQQEEAAKTPKTPVNQRLFEEPEAVLEEYRRSIYEQAVMPLQAQVAQMAIQQDMAYASLRHQDIWNDAWGAWYGQVQSGENKPLYEQVMKSPSPGEALVNWYKTERMRQEVGDDPAAYREKLRAELLAELQGGQATEEEAPRKPNGQFAAPKQQVRLPTATGRMGSSRGGNDLSAEDDSDDAIFESARPRRK